MLQDIIQPHEELSIDGLPSPTASQILSFCNEGDTFLDAFTSSAVLSCTIGAGPGVYCYDDISSPLLTNQALAENEQNCTYVKCASYPTSPPPPLLQASPQLPDQQDQVERMVLPEFLTIGCSANSQFPQEQFSSVCDETLLLDNLSYSALDPRTSPSHSFMDSGMSVYCQSSINGLPASSSKGQEYFTAATLAGRSEPGLLAQEFAPQYQTAVIHIPDSIHRNYSEVLGDDQHLVGRCSSSTSLGTDIPALEESTIKVSRISVEERKEKIQRYMKKRNERNFNKKIKYACRKTLADSRPRVRGRFAKNGELGQVARPSTSQYECEEDPMKQEESLGSSDILPHIGGLNSLQYNFDLDSWMGLTLFN